MVCKEEVIGWFKDLSGFKRIDFMCGLLNMCVPFELRFFGTCVEDLGKKDFHYLREAEHRANSTAEIAKLTNLNDDVTRSKLIVSLALLEASNHVCSNVIFQILTDAGKVAHLAAAAPAASATLPSPTTNSSAIVVDPKIGEEIFLLFTMALHHPAFTFDQKSSLGKQLKTVKASFKAAATTCEDQDLTVKCKEDSVDSLDSKSSTTSCAQSYSSGGGVAAVRTTIKHLEMKRVQKRKPEKKSEFKIQVTWSNGDVTEVSKTYQELYDFSLKVQQLLPDDKRSHRQDRSFPVLPALRHVAGHRQSDDANEDGSGKLSDLVHQFLCRMPPLLLDCDPVTWFFHGQASHSPQWSSAAATSPSHRSSQGTMLASPRGGVHMGAGAGSRVSPDGGRVKSLTIYNSQIERSGKISQEANKGKLPNSGSPTSSKDMSTALLTNSIVPHQVPCSSPVSSPQASPVSSPFASPSQSGTSSRAASPWIQRSVASSDGPPVDAASLNHMAKQDRAKRCRGKLTNCSVDEHRALTDDDLMKQGISPAFINQIKVLDNRNPPNGLNLHSMLERMSVPNPTTPSSVAPTITSGGLSFSSSHSDVNNPSSAQLYPSEALGRHPTYPVMPQPPPVGAQTHVTSCSPMPTATGMPGTPTLIPCSTLHHPGQQPHRQSVTHFHSSQQPPTMHCQVQSQRRAASAESSPSCSQNSSPPESPSLDSRNHYDSSCSEETDKDKELDKSKFPDLGRVQKNCTLKTKGIESSALSNTVPSKGRCEEESHYLLPSSVGMISTPRPEVVNPMMPMRPMVLPDLASVTVSLPVANVPMNSAAAFQRSRLNPASTPSPPGSVVHAFKSGPQHMASPVRNSNNTIIIENSQFVKTLSSGAPAVPAVAPSAHNRWEGMNGSCPSTLNGSNAQPPPPNPALFIFTTAQIVTQAENVAACRTCTTCVSSPSMVVTCASRHPLPQVTSVNMSSVVRSHNNKLTSPHLGDETLKVNSNSLNSSMPPTSACLPCVGQAEPHTHPIPSYPPPPISYTSMPPSPVAPTTVTYTTPAFVPANSGPLANSQPANSISQGQVSHNSHGGMPPVSTGCSNTCACSCSGATPPGNLPYSPGFLHLHQMSSAVFAGFPGFLQPHNTNGFISPTLPNFPFAGGHLAGAIPNGITPELIYSGAQFPMLQQQQNGSHHSTAPTNPGFLPGPAPAPNLAYHSNYTNTSGQSLLKGKNISCYNCGVVGHRGIDCKEATMEEITKPGQFRLNYAPSSKPMESTE